MADPAAYTSADLGPPFRNGGPKSAEVYPQISSILCGPVRVSRGRTESHVCRMQIRCDEAQPGRPWSSSLVLPVLRQTVQCITVGKDKARHGHKTLQMIKKTCIFWVWRAGKQLGIVTNVGLERCKKNTSVERFVDLAAKLQHDVLTS